MLGLTDVMTRKEISVHLEENCRSMHLQSSRGKDVKSTFSHSCYREYQDGAQECFRVRPIQPNWCLSADESYLSFLSTGEKLCTKEDGGWQTSQRSCSFKGYMQKYLMNTVFISTHNLTCPQKEITHHSFFLMSDNLANQI